MENPRTLERWICCLHFNIRQKSLEGPVWNSGTSTGSRIRGPYILVLILVGYSWESFGFINSETPFLKKWRWEEAYSRDHTRLLGGVDEGHGENAVQSVKHIICVRSGAVWIAALESLYENDRKHIHSSAWWYHWAPMLYMPATWARPGSVQLTVWFSCT